MPSKPVVSPNLGLYLDRPPYALNSRMLQDGLNFRVKEGKLINLNMGYERFESSITLNGPVLLIANFFLRDGSEKLIFGTKSDLYSYSANTHTVVFITPIYATGTASAAGTAVTGVGTTWLTNVANGDQISFGSATQTNPAATWFTVSNVTGNTTLTLTGSAGIVANGPYTIRRLFHGDVDDIWVYDTFVNASPSAADEWWATNGVDVPVRWNGVSTAAERMDSLGFTCKTLQVYSNMMIFANLVQGGTFLPTDMINSNTGEPQNVTTGLANQFKVHGGVEAISRLVPLGDSLVVYSGKPGTGRITVVQFQGAPLIFTFRHVAEGVGPIGARAVVDFGDYHEFIGFDSQYRFDGAVAKEIGKQLWRDTIRQQDPIRAPLTYAFFDDENGEVVWVLPLTTDTGSGTVTSPPGRAHSEHYLEDVGQQYEHPFSRRTFVFTAQGYFTRQQGITWDQLTSAWSSYNFRWNDQFFFAAFPLILVGDNNGKLYTLNTSQNADGAAINTYVRFGRRALGDGHTRSLVRRVYPFVTRLSTPINVTLRLADHAQGPATLIHTDSFDQNLNEGAYFTSPMRRGRYLDLEFGSNGVGQPWEIGGYDLDIAIGGRR